MKHVLLFLFLFTTSAFAVSFDTWIASYGLTGDNAAATADPDHDGIPNLMEYALDGLNPLTNSSDHPSMPKMGFVRRTGQALGAWEFASYRFPPLNGIGSIWHPCVRFTARADVENIRYIPQLSDGKLMKWFDGRSAFSVQILPGNAVQAVANTKGNRYPRFFMRLKVITDTRAGMATIKGVLISGSNAQSLVLQSPAQQLKSVGSASTVNITTGDLLITRATASSRVTDYLWQWTPFDQNVGAVVVTRTSSNPAVLRPSDTNPYLWEWVSNGTAIIRLRTQTSTYNETVTTSTVAGGVVDTITGPVAGSLREHLNAQIDSRLTGKTVEASVPVYTTQNHATSTYVRNTGIWTTNVDLTPISPWNSESGGHKAGTLISPCHVIFATHYLPAVGTTIRFVAADNTVVTRTLTAIQSLAAISGYYPDLSVGKLDSDVPSSIAFARVLPDNWTTKLPTLATLPVPAFSTDQEEKATVRDLSVLGTSGTMIAQFWVPSNVTRRAFYEDVISGDSGSPACLIINDKIVLLTCWTGGGGGMGTSVQGLRSGINALMTSLGGGYNTLTDVDLSAFTSF